MPQDLRRLETQPKMGTEAFRFNGENLPFDLLSFWQWSSSDLVSNAMRGVLAEFIVAKSLGISTTTVRTEWDAFDLITEEGLRIEVKSAAYLQSWHQTKYSSISFNVQKKRGWDAMTNYQPVEATRSADVYVFALLAHQDKQTIDPLDLNQWQFYVLPTEVLNQRQRSQYSITLKSLESLAGKALSFLALKDAVQEAAQVNVRMRTESTTTHLSLSG